MNRCFLCVTLVVGAWSAAAFPAVPILLDDLDAGADGNPAGWAFHPVGGGDTPSWHWDATRGRGGGGCLVGGVTAEADAGRWERDPVAIPEGCAFLRLTAWVRSEDVRSSAGAVSLRFLDAEGKPVGGEPAPVAVSASRDWTRYVGYAAVPEGAAQVSVACWVGYAFTKCGVFRWDDIALTPVDAPVEPITAHVDDTPPPEPTAEEQKRGCILFSRHWMRTIFKTTVPKPEERVMALQVRVNAGEYEPVVLAVYALEDINVLVGHPSLVIGGGEPPDGTIPGAQVAVRSVSFRTRVGQGRWGLFNETTMHDVPLFLEQCHGLEVPANTAQPFWITVHVPRDTPPGEYEHTLHVAISRGSEVPFVGPGVPLHITVDPPVEADTGDTMFAMYARMARSDAWLEETFADLKAHGMTGIAVSGNSGLPMSFGEDGVPVVVFNGGSDLERNMAACQRHGLMAPALWLMSGAIPKFCKEAGPMESDAFAAAYRSVIQQITDHGRAAGWPEIIFQPVDEPFEWEKRMAENQRLLELLKSVPGVRTEGDGMNGKWENFTPDIYALTDLINLHDGPMLDRHLPVDMPAWRDFQAKAKADGKKLWFYNVDLTGWHPEPVRFMTGFGLWKAKADGIIEWCYMCPVSESDPGKVYGDPGALLYRFPKAPGESGGPTIAYEAAREGIEDYRAVKALYDLCAEARADGSGELRAAAETMWAAVESRLATADFSGCTGVAAQGGWTGECEVLEDGRRIVRGEHALDNGWTVEDYDSLRREITGFIQALGKMLR